MSVCFLFVLFCVGSGFTWGKKTEPKRLDHNKACMKRVSQEEKSLFWEVIVSAILSEEMNTYKCPIPNDF
jgi:hypothetical protein